MKKIITLIYLFLSFIIFAQNECDHDVKTDPLNPSNSALPVGINSQKYLNGFDWFPRNLAGEYEDYPCTNISFGGVQYPEMNNILLNNMDFYDYLDEGPLPLTENGWELLLVNVGRYPDNNTEITAGNFLYGIPYIVIYNRYSGVIRIFMNYGLDGNLGGDAIKFSLYFEDPNKLSGLLRYTSGEDIALNQNTTINSVSGVVKGPELAQQWASTDVRIAYDPCTCFYPSKLKIKFEQISSSTITLHGRGIELTNQPLVNNTTLQVNPNEYLSGFDAQGNTISGDGIAMHKSMLFMINDYLAKYEKYNKDLVAVNEHNEKVKQNLSILKTAKNIVQFAISPPAGWVNFLPGMTEAEKENVKLLQAEYLAEVAATEYEVWQTQEIYEAYNGLGAFAEHGNEVDWFKTLKTIRGNIVSFTSGGATLINNDELFKIVGQIFGEKGKLFIANNFKEQTPPKAPTMPTANFSEMHYEGTLTTITPVFGPEFYTPGTYGSPGTGTPIITNVYEYPVYNEVLGTFALLESPKIQLWESGTINYVDKYENEIFATGGSFYPYEVETARYKSWEKNYEIKLKNDLKYVFNTALDIKSTDVQASFNIVAKLNDVNLPPKSKLSLYNNDDFKANANSNSIDLDVRSKIVNYGYDFGEYASNLDFDENHFQDSIDFAPSTNRSNDTIEIQTTYVPIDAFFPVISRFGLKNEFISFDKQSINSDQYYNSDIFYGDQDYPFTLNTGSSILTQKANNFNVNNGYKYSFEIELKLIVNMEFNTVNEFGVTNKLTQVLTYKIDPSNIEMYPQPMSYNGSLPNIIDLSQFQFDMTLNGAVFNGQEVEGCQLVGNTYTCQAMNNLKITDDILVSSGYNVNLFGGNGITVENESIISPQSVLAINPVLDYSHPMPNATSAYVQSFCQGSNGNAPAYKANAGVKRIQELEVNSSTNPENLVQNFNWDFSIYPNPTTSNTTVVLSGNNSTNYSVEVSDMTGKVIYSKVNNGDVYSSELELNGISKGVYFVKVNTLQGTKMKQLVIQ